MTIACHTCAYWQPQRPREMATVHRTYDVEPQPKGPLLGQCRRYPPLRERTDQGVRVMFPLTPEHLWCGEHAVDERPAA